MDEIVVVPYHSEWSQRFAEEAALLKHMLPSTLISRIEHFGSTAIPGVAAKPIIDILLGVDSLERAKQEAVPILESLGYSYWRDDPRTDHLFLVKGLPPNGPRSHHLHIVEPDNADWERLLFRDYLRSHPDEALRYANFKQELAEQYRDDREAYTEAKTEYIRTITQLARQAQTQK